MKGIKKNIQVSPGQPLAESARPGRGWPTASIPGLISGIDQFHITIDHQEDASGRPPEPVDLNGLTGLELAKRLAAMGLGLPWPERPASRLVVSALDSEPGLELARILWRDQRVYLKAGLELARNLHPEAKGDPITAAPKPIADQVDWGPVVRLNTRYPAGLKPLVKKRALGIEDARGDGVFTLRELYLLGRLARTGLPLTEIPATVLGANYIIPAGVTPRHLLNVANHRLEPGEGVFLGGWFRGRAIADPERGLWPEVEALWVYRPNDFQVSAVCSGCRECRRVCPARLKPDLIAISGRAARPGARLAELRPDLCLACALCSYHCPFGFRPSVWVRLAGECWKGAGSGFPDWA